MFNPLISYIATLWLIKRLRVQRYVLSTWINIILVLLILQKLSPKKIYYFNLLYFITFDVAYDS